MRRKFRRTAWRSIFATGAAAILILTGYSSSSGASAHAPSQHSLSDEWTAPNGNDQGTRYVGGPINSHTVSQLGVAWTAPILANTTDFPGGYSTQPVVVHGVAYTQDNASNVYAIDQRTGKVLWTTVFNDPTNGPDGVAVADGKVFGATESIIFALDARTGKQVWSKKIIRNDNEGIDMAPAVHDGTVYISTVPGNLTKFYAGNGVGVLWALNDATGAVKWKFDTVPPSLWGDPDVNSGGGLWYPPSFDAAGNLYVDVANPAPFLGTPDDPWGSSRPGANLYTDSLVKLDSRTGKVMWYHQVLPHDIYDWDVQDSPVVTNAGGRPVVLATGKIGFVYEFDQRTGQLLWKTSVGIHNGHDNDDLLAMSGQFSKLPQLPVTLFPGALGGVPAPAAADDSTAYVAVNNLSVTWTNQEPPPVFPAFTAGKGEVVALDLVTGKIKWDVPLDQSPYGATTVVNDLVFTTTFDGTVYALNKHTGAVVWQAKLPAASNAPVAVNGDTLYAGAGWTEDSTQKAAIVAFRLRN